MTLSPGIVKKSTKNTKFKELVKMVNEAEDKKHPSTVSAKHAIEKVNNMRDNGQLTTASAPFQHSDGESDEERLSNNEDDFIWNDLVNLRVFKRLSQCALQSS